MFVGPSIAAWVSTFRNNQPSEVVGDIVWIVQLELQSTVDDGIQWMVRFAVSGRVVEADEKHRRVRAATMQFIREKTDIPLPSIIAWGCSKMIIHWI